MLTLEKAHRNAGGGNGLSATGFAELRNQLANGASMDDACRQRLLTLAQRLANVQAHGSAYAGITLSPMAEAAVDSSVALM